MKANQLFGTKENMKNRLAIESELAKQPGKIECKCKAHIIREDGSNEAIDAKSLFVEMEGGRDLTIHLYERFKGEGIGIHTLFTGEDPGVQIEISLGAANVCYVNVKKR